MESLLVAHVLVDSEVQVNILYHLFGDCLSVVPYSTVAPSLVHALDLLLSCVHILLPYMQWLVVLTLVQSHIITSLY